MVSLESGENKSIVLQSGGQFRRGLGLNGRVDCSVERVKCLLYERTHRRVGKHISREASLGKYLAHGAVEHLTVKWNAPDISTRERQQIRLI